MTCIYLSSILNFIYMHTNPTAGRVRAKAEQKRFCEMYCKSAGQVGDQSEACVRACVYV